MQYREVAEHAREKFFGIINSFLQGKVMELEVASLDIGDQIEGKWVKLESLSYNVSKDTLYIHTTHLDYSIGSPHTICIGEELGLVRSIAMKDAQEYLQVLKFREPLLLEAALEFQ